MITPDYDALAEYESLLNDVAVLLGRARAVLPKVKQGTEPWLHLNKEEKLKHRRLSMFVIGMEEGFVDDPESQNPAGKNP